MSRYGGSVDVLEWLDVSSERPCPICGGASGCGILEDGEFACCLNVVCEWPMLTGGWLHRLPPEVEKVAAVDEVTEAEKVLTLA